MALPSVINWSLPVDLDIDLGRGSIARSRSAKSENQSTTAKIKRSNRSRSGIDQKSSPSLRLQNQEELWYFFVKRGLKLRVAIDEIANDTDLRKSELDEEEWRILGEVVELLSESAIITKYVEGSGYPTLSLVVPMYNRLLVVLEEVAKGHHSSITHPLIVEWDKAGLQKLSGNYNKAYWYGGNLHWLETEDAIFLNISKKNLEILQRYCFTRWTRHCAACWKTPNWKTKNFRPKLYF